MTTYAFDRVKWVHSGTMAAGQTFSWSLTTTPVVEGLSNATIDSMYTAARAVFNTYVGAAGNIWRSLLGTDGSYKNLTAYYYPSGSPTATYSATGATSAFTGTGNSTTPYDCAVVVSLRTAVPGRSGRGRIYLPASGATLSAHQLSSPSVTAIGSGAKAYFEALIAAIAGVQASYMVVASSIAGDNRITRVVTDSKMDTQRRRENKIAAAAVDSTTVTV